VYILIEMLKSLQNIATIQPGEPAAVWYFTRNADNGTTVGWLCDHCDGDLLGQADDDEGGN
jgi:hypothetical protein